MGLTLDLPGIPPWQALPLGPCSAQLAHAKRLRSRQRCREASNLVPSTTRCREDPWQKRWCEDLLLMAERVELMNWSTNIRNLAKKNVIYTIISGAKSAKHLEFHQPIWGIGLRYSCAGEIEISHQGRWKACLRKDIPSGMPSQQSWLALFDQWWPCTTSQKATNGQIQIHQLGTQLSWSNYQS